MRKLLPLNNYLFAYAGKLEYSQWVRMINSMPDTTVSKRVIKSCYKLFFYLNLDRLLSSVIRENNYFNVAKYFHRYDGYVVFSSNLNERYRFYSFACSGDMYFFVKVIKRGCIESLGFEEILVERFLQLLPEVRVVSHARAEIVGDNLVLEYTMLPSGSYRVEGKGLYERYFRGIRYSVSSGFYSKEVLKELQWYDNYMNMYSDTDFNRYVTSLLDDTVELGLVHGDLGSENIYCHHDIIWIIDWEKASDMAPVMTDYIGLNLKEYMFQINGIISINGTSLKQMFGAVYIDDFSYKNFLLALVFYGGTSFKPIVSIIENFRFDEV